jgi:hypothetical protein
MYMARQANNWECQPCYGSCWKTCPEIDHLWRERDLCVACIWVSSTYAIGNVGHLLTLFVIENVQVGFQ